MEINVTGVDLWLCMLHPIADQYTTHYLSVVQRNHKRSNLRVSYGSLPTFSYPVRNGSCISRHCPINTLGLRLSVIIAGTARKHWDYRSSWYLSLKTLLLFWKHWNAPELKFLYPPSMQIKSSTKAWQATSENEDCWSAVHEQEDFAKTLYSTAEHPKVSVPLEIPTSREDIAIIVEDAIVIEVKRCLPW